MTLGDLLRQYRIDTQDRAAPYLWGDEELVFWFNEAEQEAAIRKQLLRENTDPAMCVIQIKAGVRSYPKHPLIYEVVYANYVPFGASAGTVPWPLGITSSAEMDRISYGWRNLPNRPSAIIEYDNRIEVNCNPVGDWTMNLEVYRLPLQDMVEDTDSPEINAVHHRRLLDWVKFRAYDKQDADTFDPNKSMASLARFEDYFGLRPDADGRKKRNSSVPHHNMSYT